MNNLGFSNDNLHIGDVRIKGQNQTIIIGNENGGDGYILPTEKGTEGQVITMNADNSTSFQDGGGTTGRIVKNLFTMIDPNIPNSATPNNVYSTGYGSLDLGSIDNFPVGATIHLYTKGTWQVGGTSSDTGTFRFIINSGQSTELQYTAPVDGGILTQINLYYTDITCQRTGTNEYKFKGAGIISTDQGNIVKINWVSNTITPATPFSNFDIRFAFSTSNNLFYPITSVFLVGMILDSSLLISPPPAPTSHTALTDLTAGDAGHTQFALLQGRSGGQVLSGGITPSNFLTLKSHTAGLNNIVVKDLNTTFEKNIDMNQNQIDNVLVINNQAGQPLNLIGGSNVSAVILDATPTQGVIIGSNVGASTDITGDTSLSLRCNNGGIVLIPSTQMGVIIGGLPRFAVDSTQVNVGNDLIMNNNDIGQCGNLEVSTINNLTSVGGLFAGTSDSLNVAATTAEISILPLTFVGTGFVVSPNGFSVGDTFKLELTGPFNSNNNDTLTIRLKGGPTSTTLLTTLVVPLNASTGSVFQLSTLFQIRAIGGAGVADIISDADLTYNQSGAGGSFVGEQSLSQNNTTFDTTLANVLDVTAQFSSTNANNNMTTRLSKLNKVF